MEEFVQEFRRAAKESEYEERSLVEESKCTITVGDLSASISFLLLHSFH